jgi:drug/metabolite transporter (DMT)-like permease
MLPLFCFEWLAPRKKTLLFVSAVFYALTGWIIQLATEADASTADVALAGGLTQGLLCASVLREDRVPFFPSGSYQRRWVALRGIASTFTVVCWFYACICLPLGNVMAMINLHPVVAAALGHLLLNEKLQPLQVLAIFGSLAGVLLVSRPDFIFGVDSAVDLAADPLPYYRSSSMGYFMGIVSSIFGGVQYVIFRKARDVNTLHFMLWAQVVMVMIAPLLALVIPDQAAPLAWASSGSIDQRIRVGECLSGLK